MARTPSRTQRARTRSIALRATPNLAIRARRSDEPGYERSYAFTALRSSVFPLLNEKARNGTCGSFVLPVDDVRDAQLAGRETMLHKHRMPECIPHVEGQPFFHEPPETDSPQRHSHRFMPPWNECYRRRLPSPRKR
jgi:hypothetical protein